MTDTVALHPHDVLDAHGDRIYQRDKPICGISEQLDNCLPRSGPLHAYLWWSSHTTWAPSEFHVASMLSTLAYEIGRRGYRIETGVGPRRPSLACAIVAKSAQGKSTAIGRAQDFYREFLRAEQGDKYADPYVMAEGSVPGLVEVLAPLYDEKQGGTYAILYSGEFTRILAVRDSLSEVMNQLLDGEEFTRHLRGYQTQKRKEGYAPSTIKAPAISGIFATTPRALNETATKIQVDGGFFSRLLWWTGQVEPARMQLSPGLRIREMAQALTEWAQWTAWLAGIEALAEDRCVRIGPEVNQILQDTLLSDLRGRVNEDDRLNPYRQRGIMHAQVIAGLYAVLAGRLEVLSDDMDLAINLVEYSFHCVEGLVARWGISAEHQLVEDVAGYVAKAGEAGIRRHDLYPLIRVSKRELDDAVQTLLDAKRIVEARTRAVGPGRPAIVYRTPDYSGWVAD